MDVSAGTAPATAGLGATALASLVERLPDAFLAADAAGVVVAWNGNAERLFGRPAGEAIGRRVDDLLVPEQEGDAHPLALAHRALRGESSVPPHPVEAEVLGRDGRLLPVELSIAALEPSGAWAFGVSLRDVTERNAFRLQLGEAEELFRRAFHEAPVGKMLTSLDELRLLRLNPALADMLGYEPEELLGRTIAELSHPDDLAANVELAHALRAGDRDGFRIETRYLHRDGGVVWADLSVSVLHDRTGAPRCFIAQAIDITQRRQTEEELREERRRLTDAQSLALLGSWEWEPATDRVTLSDGLLRVMGFDRDTAPERFADLWRYIHPEDREQLERQLRDARAGELTETEYRIVRPDGGVREIVGRRRRMDTADGVERLAGIAQDVTAIRESERERRRAEAQFRQSIEQAPIGMAITGLDGRLREGNRALCELLGYPTDELAGLDYRALTHPEDLARDEPDFARLFAGEIENLRLDKRYLRKDGGVVWAELSCSLVRDDDGTPLHVISQINDVSDRRRAEEALRRSEREAARARDAALEASRMKSRFVANMSHEIRTPMNGVMGMVEALLHGGLTGEQRRYAETARASAEALLRIIDDILDFSKVEAGMLELERTDLDLGELLQETMDLLARRVRDKGLDLVLHVDRDVPRRVLGDPVRLRQVLINLLTNAIKFTDEGDVVVRVRRAGEGTLRIEVIDSGVGIAPHVVGRLFEPFTQADSSTTRRYGGTGLGLSISRQLVELMGGEIGAYAEEGSGSVFWFTVALEPVGAVAPERPAPLAGARVLLVADRPAQRAALTETLEGWGVAVQAAEAAEAPRALLLAAAGGEAPEVVVIDEAPGGEDGGALARRLAQATPAGAPPTLLLSAAGLRRALPADAACLVKPARWHDLERTLLELTGRDAPPAPAPAPPAPGAEQGPLGAGRRVLVAEDNPVNQQVAVLSLERLGFAVDVAADGSEAVQRLDGTPYDLVLMDCQMPVMDGYAATAEIRRREDDAAHTPVIAMTASSMAEDRERCLAAGMDDFIPKPVRGDALEAALRRWLPAR